MGELGNTTIVKRADTVVGKMDELRNKAFDILHSDAAGITVQQAMELGRAVFSFANRLGEVRKPKY